MPMCFDNQSAILDCYEFHVSWSHQEYQEWLSSCSRLYDAKFDLYYVYSIIRIVWWYFDKKNMTFKFFFSMLYDNVGMIDIYFSAWQEFLDY